MSMTVQERDRPRILIPMTMVWVVRNVVHSGLLEKLAAVGVEPVLLVPELPPGGLGEYLSGCGATLAPLLSPESRTTRLDWVLNAVLGFSNVRRNAPKTYRLRRRWYERHLQGKTKARFLVAGFLSAFFVQPRAYECLRRIWERRTLSYYNLEPVVRQIEELGCSAVWFNNWGMGREMAYVAAAAEMGLPAITSIISFDNVLTKGVRPSFDHYLVWSTRGAEELVRSDARITEEQVSILGSPQFDFHRRSELIWGRAATLEKLGLPPNVRFFVYGAGREVHSPGEIDLVNRLALHLEQDPRWENYRIVVRFHPLDAADRWHEGVSARRIVLCEPFQPPVDEKGWSWSSVQDQALLISSLRHADACLSVASTIALDAAILGTPAIGLRLDQDRDAPNEVYFDAFELDHYRPLVESRGIWIVRSWSEVFKLLELAVEIPEEGKEERERMVASVCGPVDGHSSEETVKELLTFLNLKRNEVEIA